MLLAAMATPRAQNITTSRRRRRPAGGVGAGVGAPAATIGLVGDGMTAPPGSGGGDLALHLVRGLPDLEADAIRELQRGGRARHDRSDELRPQRAAQVVERRNADHIDPPTA